MKFDESCCPSFLRLYMHGNIYTWMVTFTQITMSPLDNFCLVTFWPGHMFALSQVTDEKVPRSSYFYEQWTVWATFFFLNQVLCRSIFYLIIVNLISNWIKSASLKKKIISYIYVYTGTYTDPKFKHWVGRVQTNNFLKLVSPKQ